MKLSQGFTPAIQNYVLASEGGYVNHPRDPGKAPNMGITIATLRAWRGRPVPITASRKGQVREVGVINRCSLQDLLSLTEAVSARYAA